MEKAFKLDFVNDKTGSLYVNCCGCSQTEPLHNEDLRQVGAVRAREP